MRKTIERYGYDADATPLDTLLAGPDAMHQDVAEAMDYPDKED